MPLFNTELYLPLVDFLQEDKRIYCVVVETFCDLIFPQICEPLEACRGWGVVGCMGDKICSMRLSLLEVGLPAFLRVKGTSSV